MKKFRFPKGIRQVNFPLLSPLGFNEVAKNEIETTLSQLGPLPANARVRFEYRYPGGISEIQIYK